MNEETLYQLWSQATDLPDTKELHDELTGAIINEVMEAHGGPPCCSPGAIQTLTTIIEDLEAFQAVLGAYGGDCEK